ncbi:MAG: hypothetical protein HUU16_00110 [Candidatus Omnitrophica bacterium]|nr:hypothetical protein [Candidatus Omnitrophota bacterium]
MTTQAQEREHPAAVWHKLEKLEATVFGNGAPGLDETVRNLANELSRVVVWLKYLTIATVLQLLGFDLARIVELLLRAK